MAILNKCKFSTHCPTLINIIKNSFLSLLSIQGLLTLRKFVGVVFQDSLSIFSFSCFFHKLYHPQSKSRIMKQSFVINYMCSICPCQHYHYYYSNNSGHYNSVPASLTSISSSYIKDA